uniref:Fe2OG dioxygenase domain-containing protein n=1 Tax=Auxenochlorella protothecoides TaxID=3075 RepID=A0A1D1ZNZ9_AUXPR
MTSTFEPMESLLGSLQVQRPSRARGRQGKVPMLPILLMTGAIVGCMFLLASLLNVGPVPDTNFFVQQSDGQRRVLNQRQDLHVPLASHPLQHLVGEHLTGSADGVAALGAIDGGAPTGHPTDGHPKIVSSVKDPQEALQSTTLPSPPPKKAKPVVVSPPDEVISGQGPSLDQATLAGGWMLTPEIFHRAASHPNAVVVSKEKPYIVQYKGFLSQAEIDHLLELSGDGFVRSGVVSDESVNDRRTSYGVWLSGARRDKTVLDLQHRLHSWIGIPEEFGESLYMLRYEQGQKYDAHTDNCRHRPSGEELPPACQSFLKRAGGPAYGPGAGGVSGGDRLATFIMYVHAPDEGGETVFPKARTPPAAAGEARALESVDAEADDPCFRSDTLRLSPAAGDAVLFWDYVPTDDPGLAVPDPHALHGGCPVRAGQKFIVTRWIRASRFW